MAEEGKTGKRVLDLNLKNFHFHNTEDYQVYTVSIFAAQPLC